MMKNSFTTFIILLTFAGNFLADSHSLVHSNESVISQKLGSDQTLTDCGRLILSDINECRLKNPPDELSWTAACNSYLKQSKCSADVACSKCDHDAAIQEEKAIRLNLPTKLCQKSGWVSPEPLDKPFCSPTFFTKTVIIIIAAIGWIILLVLIVVVLCCCCGCHSCSNCCGRGRGHGSRSSKGSRRSRRGSRH